MATVPRPAAFYTEPERVEVGGLEVAYRLFTGTEHAAQVGEPELEPRARLDGRYVDTRKAYIPEVGG